MTEQVMMLQAEIEGQKTTIAELEADLKTVEAVREKEVDELRKARDALTVEVGRLQAKMENQCCSCEPLDDADHANAASEKRAEEAEAAVKLLVDGWDITTSPDCREIDSVCDGCDKAESCGPDTDTEPCDKWREAEARDDARAAANKVLERMKA
jgi:hypothetical protein